MIFVALALLAISATAAPTWFEMRTQQFDVYTDSSADDARHVAQELERMRAVFARTFPKLKADTPTPTLVLAFKNQKEFNAMLPAASQGKGKVELAGYMIGTGVDGAAIMLALDYNNPAGTYSVIYGSYTNVVTRNAPWMPLWERSGLAKFYRTATIDNSGVALGKPEVGGTDIELLRKGPLIPLRTLLTVDYTSPMSHAEGSGELFFAESWALVHYLMLSDAKKPVTRLAQFDDLLSQGMDSMQAAAQAFGNLDALQTELDKYLHHLMFGYFIVNENLRVDKEHASPTTVPAAKVDADRAFVLALLNRYDDARTLAQATLQADAKSAVAEQALGTVALKEDKDDEALTHFQKAVQLDPTLLPAAYHYADLSMRSEMNDATAAEVNAALQNVIKIAPEYAYAHDRLAVLTAQRHGDLDAAYHEELVAVQLEPGEIAFRLNAVFILETAQRWDDAVQVANEAMKIAKPEEMAEVQSSLRTATQARDQMASIAARKAIIRDAPAAQPQGPVIVPSGPPPNAQPPQVAALKDDGPPGVVRLQPGRPPAGSTSGNGEKPETVAGPVPGEMLDEGTASQVSCTASGAMDIIVTGDGDSLPFHAVNFRELHYGGKDGAPIPVPQACTELKGKHLRVHFVVDPTLRAGVRVIGIDILP